MTKRKRTVILSAVATMLLWIAGDLVLGKLAERKDPVYEKIADIASSALTNCLEADDSLLCGIVSVKETGSRRGPETVIIARRGNHPARLDDFSYYAGRMAVVPGAVMQTATLAWLMDHHGIHPDQALPTLHGQIPGLAQDHYIPEYEYATGRDSISVREGFLMSSRYCIDKLVLDTDLRKGLFRYFDDFFGSSRAMHLPNLRLISDRELAAVADGRGLLLSPDQIVNFYDLIAGGGLRTPRRYYPKKQVFQPETAAELRLLLRQNVTDGTGRRLAGCAVPIAGKTGFGVMDRGLVPGSGYIGPDRPMSASSFAGFFPADAPRYTMLISIIKKDDSIHQTARVMNLYREIVEQMQTEELL